MQRKSWLPPGAIAARRAAAYNCARLRLAASSRGVLRPWHARERCEGSITCGRLGPEAFSICFRSGNLLGDLAPVFSPRDPRPVVAELPWAGGRSNDTHVGDGLVAVRYCASPQSFNHTGNFRAYWLQPRTRG